MRRVVSLAPSATATARALDAEQRLVGVTTHCEASGPPAVGGWLNPDRDRVADLDPDVVLTADPLQAEVRDDLRARGHRVVHVAPTTLAEAFDAVASVGAALGRPDAGDALASDLRDRVAAVRTAVPDDPAERPVVYCEEWPDPPMAAGNWVPEVVSAAGGRYPFRAPGERSAPVDREAVVDAAPAHVLVHHCGRGTAADPGVADRGWDLDAAVHVVDDALLNQPGPRLADAVERLAATLHPGRVPASPFD